MLIIHNFYRLTVCFFCGKPKAISLLRLGMVNTTTHKNADDLGMVCYWVCHIRYTDQTCPIVFFEL
jgi:hypothetical protein